MTLRIFKYSISDAEQDFDLPKGARILSFNNQNEVPCFWAMIDDEEALTEARSFFLAGTGHELSSGTITYLGTALFHGDTLVLHLFERNRT